VSDQQAEFERWFSSQARESLAVPSDGAKVVVVKFNDFQCPACADSYFKDKDVLAKYLSSYPRDVRFVLVDYPLAPECNSSVTAVVHPAACAGAVAVRLARMNGKDTEMQEWLYSNQQGLTRDAVRQAAQNIAGVRNFDQEYARQLALVRQDAEMGGRLKIDGTPTFFINGVRVPGALRAEYLDAAIMHELRRAGVAIP
jgi:protein-disulfide isomerase